MLNPMKAFINLPMWLRLTIGLSLAAGMFLWIGIGAEKAMDEEPPFLEVCWKDGVAHYPTNFDTAAACPGGVIKLQWVKKTKTIRWDMPANFDVYLWSHQRAVAWVNEELGFEAVRMTTGDADIVINQGDYEGSKNGAMATQHSKKDGVIQAVIMVKVPGDTRQWMLEEKHEILHALGLAHKSTGIMSKSLDEADKQRVWLLRPNDRKALRKLLLTPDQ